MRFLFLSTSLLLIFTSLTGQQEADTSFNPAIPEPMYDPGSGPVVFIDERHNNFHTKDGRYSSFARLLERDGYVVEAYTGNFTSSGLENGKILVISNALNEANVEEWVNPCPSAFNSEEITVVREWVEQGGSLFLIADHMPMGGAAADMAATFGFQFTNGFALDTSARGRPAVFDRTSGTLHDNPITNGKTTKEKVDKVLSFTGQAFRIPPDAMPILTLTDNFINFLPDTAWVFRSHTPRQTAGGWSQGACKEVGEGRVVFFGEAAMFSAQLAGPQQFRMGMNHPEATQNYQLLLNIVHWLDGRL